MVKLNKVQIEVDVRLKNPYLEIDPRKTTIVHIEELLEAAKTRSKIARDRFGLHPSAEFACCRISEEVGELVQAATATSKGRDINRREHIIDEAIDVVAMVIRLLEEWPDGMPSSEAGGQ